jgi:hypothetical protein
MSINDLGQDPEQFRKPLVLTQEVEPELKHSDPVSPSAISKHLADLKVGLYDSRIYRFISLIKDCPVCGILRIALIIGFVAVIIALF